MRAIARVHRDAHAGRDLQTSAPHRYRVRCGLQQAFQHWFGVFGLCEINQHRHKFIAAQPRQRVAVAQGTFHPLRDRYQQLVARAVAVAVVNRFKTIQIQKHHGQALLAPLALTHGLL